jgi:hypothetical protein
MGPRRKEVAMISNPLAIPEADNGEEPHIHCEASPHGNSQAAAAKRFFNDAFKKEIIVAGPTKSRAELSPRSLAKCSCS